MGATFTWKESNGGGEAVTTATNVNFGNIDSPNLSSPNNRVVAGNNSFEKWLRGYFVTYTTIDNLKFWKSSGSLPANVYIKAAVNHAYVEPVDSASTIATSDVPTVEGSCLVPTSPGASPAYSGYIIMQMQTTGAASPGAVATQTFTMKYDEI